MSNVISLEERRNAMRKARHTIGQCAAVDRAVLTLEGDRARTDRATRAHLMQEAFADQEAAGDGLCFERARATVDRWMREMGNQSRNLWER